MAAGPNTGTARPIEDFLELYADYKPAHSSNRQLMRDLIESLIPDVAAHVNVKLYGTVGNGIADDSAAVDAAEARAFALGVPLFFPKGDYKVAGFVSRVPCYSNGTGTICGTGNFISVGAHNVTFSRVGIKGLSTVGTVADIGITCLDFDGLIVDDCTVTNCRILARNTQLAERRFLRLSRNRIDCDFTFTDFTVQQVDPIGLRGYKNFWIVNNEIRATNTHRIIKLTDTEGNVNDDVSIYNTEKGCVQGNVITGSTTSLKQVIDTYLAAFNLDISGNHFDVRGWGEVFGYKTHRQTTVVQSNVRFCHNTVETDKQLGVLQGTYGNTTAAGIYDNREQNLLLCDNQVEFVGASAADAVISTRFWHEVTANNNQIINSGAAQAYLPGLADYGSRTVMFNSNRLKRCNILFNSATGDSQGDVHTTLQKQLMANNNQLEEYDVNVPQGGIGFRSIVSAECVLTAVGNSFWQTIVPLVAAGAIAVRDCTVRSIVVTGNNCYIADTNPADERLFLTGANVYTTLVDEGNSWNNIAQGIVVYDPPNLVAGAVDAIQTVAIPNAVIGDFVKMSFSRNLSGVTLIGWISVAGTLSFQFQNKTAGALDLLSGNVRYRVTRHAA